MTHKSVLRQNNDFYDADSKDFRVSMTTSGFLIVRATF